jgi:Zn finger protein HypA/HybF involved in hydrogenase expression
VHAHAAQGPLSGVAKEALLFSFDLATEGTAIAGAAGKTALLEATLAALQPRYRVAALVGDLAS